MIGAIHIRSENTLKDSSVQIKPLCKKAQEMGYQALALTDRGIMSGIAEFVKYAMQYGLNPVPGVELNIYESGKIRGLILIAKNYTGYVGLCKLVSESNKCFINNMPVLKKDQLYALVGPETEYNGNICAFSGGIDGVLADILCTNRNIDSKMVPLKENLEESSLLIHFLSGLKEKISSTEEEIQILQVEKKDVGSRAKKNFSKKEVKLKKLSGTAAYESEKLKLDQEKADSVAAEKEGVRIQGKISRRKRKLKELKESYTEALAAEEKRQCIIDEIDKLEKERCSTETLISMVKQEALFYESVFPGEFYIELLYHGTESEAFSMPVLADIAKEMKVSTVLANDVRMLSAGENEVVKLQAIRSLKDNTWVSIEGTESEYFLKSESQICDFMEGLIPEDILRESVENLRKIFDRCSFKWPKEKHYPQYVCSGDRTPGEVLRERCLKNIPILYPKDKWTPEHEKNLEMQLKVIEELGYSDYTLILSDILLEGKNGRKDGKPGAYIGPGRGSGTGCLVNYLVGITDIDPIKYGLIFERYLNIERVSPPDIDSDIATSIRDDLIEYIVRQHSHKEGRVGVCGILTKNRLTARAAVRAACRIISSKLYDNSAKLYAAGDRIAKAIPSNSALKEVREQIYERFRNEIEKDIFDTACMLEGTLAGFGTHAAGIIISDSGDVTDYAPVINVGTEEAPVWNLQFDKEEAESIGLLKLDALGLSTLDTITNTLQRIYQKYGIWIDVNHIPFEKEVFHEIYGKGNTNGIFQCESAGMKKMWMDLKPDSIEDVIAGISLYRPGPMDYIPQYIRGKNNPGGIEYLTPQLQPILEQSYGTIVYQEQVMRIVRDLAGYSMGRSDLVRRAMSKKKEDVMNAERQNFVYGNDQEGITGCVHNGILEETAQKIYDLMIDFAKYAFNKSHATAYAIVSYQCAWLKYHYPKEFLIEAMNTCEESHIPLFLEECKKYGFEVMCPDINLSQTDFTEIDGKIYYGLGKVKGVKKNAQKITENRTPIYQSFPDFLIRSSANKVVTKALIQGGAFSSFGKSRKALLVMYDMMENSLKRIKNLKKRIEGNLENLKTDLSEKKKETVRKAIEKDNIAYEELQEELQNCPYPFYIQDNIDDVLRMENEFLYAYLTTHPLDAFQTYLKDITPIVNITEPVETYLAGMIKGLRIFQTSRNQKMAIFELEDKTGTIHTVCFPKIYEKYKNILKEGAVVKMFVQIHYDRNNLEQLTVFPHYIVLPLARVEQTLLTVETIEEWERLYEIIEKNYLTVQGSKLLLYIKETGKVISTDLYVTKEILHSGIFCTEVRKYLPL